MNEHREDHVQEWLGELREEHRAPADLKHNVMERVRQMPDPLWKRAADWLLTPRTLTFSPATAGGLVLAGLALLIALRPDTAPTAGTAGPAAAEVTGTTATPAVLASATRFVFVAPGAASVRMTGDFVAWDPRGIELEDQRGTGVWTVDVPLEPGVYQYTFIVDGSEWRPDPHAVSQIDDGFGQTNSIVIVSGETAA
jgi:hypothetical protein